MLIVYYIKKLIVAFYLSFLPFIFVYSQSEACLGCTSNIENILESQTLKVKFETVEYIYGKHEVLYVVGKVKWNEYFKLIRGFPVLEEQNDSVSGVNFPKGKLVTVKPLSEEEMNSYIEHLNCTPEKAFIEYRDLIRDIKLEKERYLQCIDEELAKGDLSKYAKDLIAPYHFLPPMQSTIPLPASITKLDFLKVFKEFVLNGNEEILPDGLRVYVYLKCNCKVP